MKRGVVESQHQLVCGCSRRSPFMPTRALAISEARGLGWHYAADLGHTCPTCWRLRKRIRRGEPTITRPRNSS